MRKYDSAEIARFLLFAFPCYWTLALMFIALAVWKVDITEPDLILLICLTAVVMAAAFLLVRNCFWISLPMMALGLYIAMQDEQHFGGMFKLYGGYMVLHYLICGAYTFKNKRG